MVYRRILPQDCVKVWNTLRGVSRLEGKGAGGKAHRRLGPDTSTAIWFSVLRASVGSTEGRKSICATCCGPPPEWHIDPVLVHLDYGAVCRGPGRGRGPRSLKTAIPACRTPIGPEALNNYPCSLDWLFRNSVQCPLAEHHGEPPHSVKDFEKEKRDGCPETVSETHRGYCSPERTTTHD